MNEFVGLVRRQVAADLRRLPDRVRSGERTRRRLARLRNIADVRSAARRSLPRAVFDFVDGAAGDEVAARRNRADLQALALHPHYLVDVSQIETATTVLGTPVATPILGAPTGLSGMVHHSGEVGLARAVHAAGSIYVLSTMASYSIEEVASLAPGPTWFQLYVWKDRRFVVELLARAKAAGFPVLVVTVDGPRTGPRERDLRNGFGIPPRVTARSALAGLRHPRWSAPFVRHGRFTIGNPPPSHDPADVGGITEYFAPVRRRAELDGPGVAARALGRAARRQGAAACGRRGLGRGGGRSRGDRLEPWRAAARRRAVGDQCAAGRRRCGRRSRRGLPRQRHQARERRRQGARARRAGVLRRTSSGLRPRRRRRGRCAARAGAPDP
jgi:hypothetical protein